MRLSIVVIISTVNQRRGQITTSALIPEDLMVEKRPNLALEVQETSRELHITRLFVEQLLPGEYFGH